MKSKTFFYCFIALAISLFLPSAGVIPAQAQASPRTWQQATQGMWGAKTTGIAVSPVFANDNLVLVSTWRGIFRSTDAGHTWTHSAGIETAPENDAVRFSPNFAVDRTAFTWAANHLYRSTDAGQSWALYYTASANIYALALSPDFGSDHTAILGTFGQGAYITTDGGVTWNPCNTGLTDSFILSAAFSPSYSSDHTLMVGTHSKGFFLSGDSAAHWTALNSGLPTYTNGSHYNISSITPSPAFATDHIIFARVLGYLYRTTDSGANWVQVSGLPLNLVSFVLAPDFATSHKAYASMHYYLGDGRYIYTSSDSGANWSQLASNALVGSIALGTTAGGETRLFGTSADGVGRSDDGGLTWTLYNEGLDVLLVNSIAVSPSYESDHTLFAVGNSHLFRSTDGAQTWSELHPEKFLASIPGASDAAASNQALSRIEYFHSVALSPVFTSDHTVFVGGERGVYRSQDSGATWQVYDSGLPETRVLAIGVSPNYANDRRVFVGLNADLGDTNIYLSEDKGETWRATGSTEGGPISSFVFSPQYSQDGVIFSIDNVYGDLHMSSSDYSVWFNKPTYTNRVVDVALSPGYPADQTYYTLENGPGIWMTTDDGETCSWLVGFLDYSNPTDLLMSPNFAQDHTFYVSFADEVGVIRSTDGGDNWQPTSSGLQGNYVEALKFLGNSGDLIAGTLRSGVWVYRDAGDNVKVYLPLVVR